MLSGESSANVGEILMLFDISIDDMAQTRLSMGEVQSLQDSFSSYISFGLSQQIWCYWFGQVLATLRHDAEGTEKDSSLNMRMAFNEVQKKRILRRIRWRYWETATTVSELILARLRENDTPPHLYRTCVTLEISRKLLTLVWRRDNQEMLRLHPEVEAPILCPIFVHFKDDRCLRR